MLEKNVLIRTFIRHKDRQYKTETDRIKKKIKKAYHTSNAYVNTVIPEVMSYGLPTVCMHLSQYCNVFCKDMLLTIRVEGWQRFLPIFITFFHFYREIIFSHRIVPIRNILPNSVVSAESVNSSKSKFDKFWSMHDFVEMIHLLPEDTHNSCSISI